ncbi:hypothetical protein EEL32_15625 [Brevibacillus laterosporus]|uniref:Uncharacterized protein n=1 Tax=Brevibacillus laterosporus TaxID=1465 RepID=A0A502IER5_BRELA|nr:hypothetical protein [Brevibacillus laterosporus]QDX92333.1 hypothetical protein EEL30_08230 [Brevibacillus laterosporus]TPG84885.1 hypothetical protein EEL32_15625 [Brevibacillus laterosporus]
MLSRTKREKHRRNKVRKRIFFGFVSLSMCFGLTMGVAYADVDVTQFLQGWYSQSAETAKQSVTDALKTETKVQKERLKAEIQRKLLESAEDLKQFTMEERSSRLKSLTDYSGHLIDNLDISNEKDKRQIERKLAAILSSAQNAMEDMADSYEAPSLEFVPAPSPPPAKGGGTTVPTPEVPPVPVPNPSEPQSPVPVPNPSEPQPPVPVPNPSEPQLPVPVPNPSEPQSSVPVPNPSEPQPPVPTTNQEETLPPVSVPDGNPTPAPEVSAPDETQQRPADIPDPANPE